MVRYKIFWNVKVPSEHSDETVLQRDKLLLDHRPIFQIQVSKLYNKAETIIKKLTDYVVHKMKEMNHLMRES